MIRKSTALILCLFLLVGLYGCAGQGHGDPLKSPMKFYYKTSDASYGDGQGATDYELRETYGHESDYVWVLTEYLKGPISQKLTAPFQRSVSIVSAGAVRVSAAAADDPELANLSGADLTVACACITPDLPGVSGSRSGVHSCGGQQIGWKNRDSFKPEQSFIGGQQRQLGQRALYAVLLRHRQPVSHRGENRVGEGQENLPDYLVHRLLEGPTEPSLAETMPFGYNSPGTGSDRRNLCHQPLQRISGPRAPDGAGPAHDHSLLTNTMTQLDDVDGVVLYAAGGH